MSHLAALAVLAAFAGHSVIRAADPPAAKPANYTRTEDVIYGRRDGHALTLDVFTPAGKRNGAGVIICVSAEYTSNRELLNGLFHPLTTKPFLDRGYVVFAVLHSSQPRYTVPDAVADTHRAVRFVKANARKYGVAADKLGITGGSAGGHLALMMGCAGRVGDAESRDPVERHSSKVAAVGCFFPPTDFPALAREKGSPKTFAAAFDFQDWDAARGTFVATSGERRWEIAAAVSPLTHVVRGAAPTRIIHMRKDPVVPFAQSVAMVAKLKECGVACDLVALDGDQHFHPGVATDIPALADWFDRHLLGRK